MSVASRRSSSGANSNSEECRSIASSDKNAELIAAVFGGGENTGGGVISGAGTGSLDDESSSSSSGAVLDDELSTATTATSNDLQLETLSLTNNNNTTNADDESTAEEEEEDDEADRSSSSRAFSTNVDVDDEEDVDDDDDDDDEDDEDEDEDEETINAGESGDEAKNKSESEKKSKSKKPGVVENIIDQVASGSVSSCGSSTAVADDESERKEVRQRGRPRLTEQSKKPSVDSDQKPKRFRRTKQQMLEDSARAADNAVSSILSRSTVEVKVEKRGRKESPFMRECLICKSRMHQDKLAEHYTKHFFSSAKCCKCRKSPTNPANFVTHILSHLPSQFFCQQCDKWFRKPLVFSRHQGECLKRQDKSSLESQVKKEPVEEGEDRPIKVETRGRKKKIVEPVVTTTKATKSQSTTSLTSTSKPTTPTPVVKRDRRGRPSLASKLQQQQETEPKKSTVAARTKTRKSTSACDLRVEKRGRKRIKKEEETVNNEEEEEEDDENLSTAANEDEDEEEDDEDEENGIDELVVSDYEMDEENTEKIEKSAIKKEPIVKKEEDDEEEEVRKRTEEGKERINGKESATISEEKNKATATESQTVMASVSSLGLTPQKELASFGTYKIKIQARRGPSQQANSESRIGAESPCASPVKPSSSNQSLLVRTLSTNSLIVMTPTKSSSSNQLINSEQPSTPSTTTTTGVNNFECPECEKKFVSYYGLVQHYDQHAATLAVTCACCEITFDDHHALVLHNSTVHQFSESSLSGGLVSSIPLPSTTNNSTINNNTPLTSSNKDTRESQSNSKKQESSSKSSQQGVKQSTKSSKSNANTNNNNEEVELVNSSTSHDLSHLPSIMTRTSRQQQQQQQQQQQNQLINPNSHHHHHHHHHPTLLPVTHSLSSKPATISAQAIANHHLTIRTNGFADLAFVDYSSKLFPFIAHNLCELWPRALGHGAEQQPLHKYKCTECGFYFPCQTSLDMHTTKRRCRMLGKRGEIATCDWFMSNSKTSDYERCVDEIISRIELQEEREKDEADEAKANLENSEKKPSEEKLLKWLDLIRVEDTDENENSTEEMIEKVRAQMLDVNSQYTRDLDRWKLNTGGLGTDASKIHLKPLVNLTRPLLIRSKKLKRRGGGPATTVAPPHPPPPPIIPPPPPPPVSKPVLQKPLFAATSGAFSGGSSSLVNSNTAVVKKRKTEELVPNKRPIPPPPVISPRTLNSQPSNVNHEAKRQRRRDNRDLELAVANSDDPDCSNDVVPIVTGQRIGDDAENRHTKSTIPTTTTQSKPVTGINHHQKKHPNQPLIPLVDKKPLKRLQQEPMTRISSGGNSSAKFDPPKLIKREQLDSAPRLPPQQQFHLPAPPPPLYKAPIINNNAQFINNTSANSSRLASASGMTNPKNLTKNMPKLQPAKQIVTSPNNNNRHRLVAPSQPPPPPVIPQQMTSPSNLPRIMPKLKPLLPNQGSPSPPQLTSSKIPPYTNNRPTTSQQPVYPKISPKPSQQQQQPSTSGTTATTATSADKSLKCKICLHVFRGQHEFLEHVIVAHPKMLKKRLNRGGDATSTATASSQQEAGFKITPVVSSSSSPSSNGATNSSSATKSSSN